MDKLINPVSVVGFDGVSDAYELRIRMEERVYSASLYIGSLGRKLLSLDFEGSDCVNFRGGVTMDIYDVDFISEETGVVLKREVVNGINALLKQLWRNQKIALSCSYH